MEGTLDLTGCSAAIRERYFDQLVMRVIPGVHETEYDLMQGKNNPEFYSRKKWLMDRKVRRGYARQNKQLRGVTGLKTIGNGGIPFFNHDIPPGFNVRSLPEGAVLTLSI